MLIKSDSQLKVEQHKQEILRLFKILLPGVESGDWSWSSVKKNAVWLQFDQSQFETVEMTIRIDFVTHEVTFSWRHLNFMQTTESPQEDYDLTFEEVLSHELPYEFRNFLIYNLITFQGRFYLAEFMRLLRMAVCQATSS